MDYFDLGDYSFPVTTNSEDAQLWFDRGLMWIYGYNHEEAIFCFDKAIEIDENCAMAYWGVSYAVGPNYNKKWVDFSEKDKSNCVDRSKESLITAKSISNLTPVERDLIKSLDERYPDDPMLEDFSDYNDAYANKMREIYRNHNTNLEVCALFAEALMNRTPWQLWEVGTGQVKAGANTQEA
ncbi:MAG: tetratricopeptide repeat protein, partial [Paracoccaceae bacterium]|nr:tetratricopeptide repeat protein [Paracoccaceae bacterium]